MPAEPYTTEKIAPSGGPAGASPSLETAKVIGSRRGCVLSQEEIEPLAPV